MSDRVTGAWASYLQEIGPLEDIDPRSLLELLEVETIRASKQERLAVTVPIEAMHQVILMIWKAVNNQPIRDAKRPTKSWRERRFQALAVDQFRYEKAILISNGSPTLNAESDALDLVARRHGIRPDTLKTWSKRRLKVAK